MLFCLTADCKQWTELESGCSALASILTVCFHHLLICGVIILLINVHLNAWTSLSLPHDYSICHASVSAFFKGLQTRIFRDFLADYCKHDCVIPEQMSRVCIVVLDDEDPEVSLRSRPESSKVWMVVIFADLIYTVAVWSLTSEVFHQ